MSVEENVRLAAVEKFFGLILIIVGVLAAYFTFTSSASLSVYTGLFGFLSIVLAAVGLVILIAKTD